jgi:hypothetical protein
LSAPLATVRRLVVVALLCRLVVIVVLLLVLLIVVLFIVRSAATVSIRIFIVIIALAHPPLARLFPRRQTIFIVVLVVIVLLLLDYQRLEFLLGLDGGHSSSPLLAVPTAAIRIRIRIAIIVITSRSSRRHKVPKLQSLLVNARTPGGALAHSHIRPLQVRALHLVVDRADHTQLGKHAVAIRGRGRVNGVAIKGRQRRRDGEPADKERARNAE